MKRRVVLLVLFIVVIFSFSSISCESNSYQDISENEIKPTYAKNVEPIIRSTCAGCHGSQFPSLQNYEEVKNAIVEGDLICRIDNQSCGSVMPQSGRMPQNVIDMIKLWRDQGFEK